MDLVARLNSKTNVEYLRSTKNLDRDYLTLTSVIPSETAEVYKNGTFAKVVKYVLDNYVKDTTEGRNEEDYTELENQIRKDIAAAEDAPDKYHIGITVYDEFGNKKRKANDPNPTDMVPISDNIADYLTVREFEEDTVQSNKYFLDMDIQLVPRVGI